MSEGGLGVSKLNRSSSSSLERLVLDCVLLFSATLFLNLCMLSRHYVGDGVRYLPLLDLPTPEIGMNKHVLFPAVFWAACRLAKASGLLSCFRDSFNRPAFLVLCQSLSAGFGAAGVTALYVWQRVAGGSRRISMFLAGVLALSNAYILHSTDMTEPIAAVPWLLAGAIVVRKHGGVRSARLLGGALVGIAAAFYISAVLGLALLASGPALRCLKLGRPIAAVVRIFDIGIGAVGSYLLVYITLNHLLQPSLSIFAIVSGSVKMSTDEGLFGSIDPRHLIGAVFGFANAWAPLRNYEGVSHILSTSWGTVAYNMTIGVVGGIVAVFLIIGGLRRYNELANAVDRYDLLGAATWLIFVFALTAFWSPTYEKLWLFGSIATLCVASIVIDRSPKERLRSNRLVFGGLSALAICSFACGVIPRRFGTNEDLVSAEILEQKVSAADFVVCPGWDLTSVYWKTLSRPPRTCWSFVDEAIASHYSPSVFEASLGDAVDRTLGHGGRVLFVGLLDIKPTDWAAFYGSRLKMPYEVLARYRGRAAPTLTFESEEAGLQVVFSYCGDRGC
jgi:hypothetical protein